MNVNDWLISFWSLGQSHSRARCSKSSVVAFKFPLIGRWKMTELATRLAVVNANLSIAVCTVRTNSQLRIVLQKRVSESGRLLTDAQTAATPL